MKQRLNFLAVIVFVIVVTITFLVLGQGRTTQRLQAGFLGIISPFLKNGSSLDRKYTEMRDGLKSLKDLEKESTELRIANKKLSAENQTLRGFEAENSKLRNALGYRERSVFQLMPARIIARDASSWYHTITIDRGSEELIEPDQPVLTEEGLIGKTRVVSKHTSTVVLIADENCKVAATIEGTREQGIVKGERTSTQGMPVISLNFLSKQANLQPGQKIYSSGVGGVFPSGVLIGAVREYKVRELDGYATLIPAVDLSTIEDVFVVVSETK